MHVLTSIEIARGKQINRGKGTSEKFILSPWIVEKVDRPMIFLNDTNDSDKY